uniref:Histone acetyltransferase n=2 Tax=Attheya septentrionalis TaxID=420275 RepID=A0A7S2UQD9_9STRA|mmetsp:Transcript_8112/g.14641  ORF Transcript_8112/g.14641 Transcript_8112/m.14641 type:complete len:440 (+) Transcript_8112:586-1905(+)
MHTEEILERAGRALPPVVSVQQCKNSLADSPLKTMNMRKARTRVEDDYLSKPFGTVLHEYKRVVRGSDENEPNEEATFVLCLADGKDELVAEYHGNVQKLALFFIETADNVDLTSNEGGGYWKALYVFRKHATEADDDVDARVKTRRRVVEEAAFDQRITRSSPLSNIAPEVILESHCRGKRKLSFSKNSKEDFQYSLVGYMTLFYFHAPFKKPKPGMVLRICQAVILPPYQRAGHGKSMFQAVYDIASGTYESKLRSLNQHKKSNGMQDEIVEINVEDPAPAFVCLRDRIDFELLKKSMRTKTPLLPSCYSGTDVMHQSFFTPLSETDTVEIGARGRITPRQVQIAFELLQLDALEQEMDQRGKGDTQDKASCASSLQKTRKTLEKRYRLMVKKRLLKIHREELGGYSDNKEKQAKLNELYEETFERYITLLGRNKKQ